MNKKYKLLKDLPSIPAGEIFFKDGDRYIPSNANTLAYQFNPADMDDKEWFEEIVIEPLVFFVYNEGLSSEYSFKLQTNYINGSDMATFTAKSLNSLLMTKNETIDLALELVQKDMQGYQVPEIIRIKQVLDTLRQIINQSK